MRPIGVTLICLYQMLRGLIGLVFGLFIVCYTGPSNQFVARASQGNAAERLDGQLRPRGRHRHRRLCGRARCSLAMAFCAGKTGDGY